MIGYVSVEEQVDSDFRRALLKASLRHWRNRLRRVSVQDRPPTFDEAKGTLARWGQAYRGIRAVRVEEIVGSVGRCQDFDASFLPLNPSMESRWCRVDRAYHRGVELPAVSLYKIGDAYYVVDGNHRVSVARYHGVAAIDAEVTELAGHARADAETAAGDPALGPQHPPATNATPLRSLAGCGARPATWS